MRLLICTQAVDLDDPILGFFHRWIEEFSRHCERVIVICLREGKHCLPHNVRVLSLGKERGFSRTRRIFRFYTLIVGERHSYDAIFVHMNQEYVFLGGLLWRAWGKRVVLWRNHKAGSLMTRMAGYIAHTVCYTSPSAYVARYRNAVRMPIGIDTEAFKPGKKEPRSILFLGRLDSVKRAHIFIAALKKLQEKEISFVARIYGEPTDAASAYAADVRRQAGSLVSAGILTMHSAVTNAEAANLFASHDIYVNLTPSGSFDKTIGEAMASGCVVIAANDAVRHVLPEKCFVDVVESAHVADALGNALALSSDERQAVTQSNRAHVISEHSLILLADRLEKSFQPMS